MLLGIETLSTLDAADKASVKAAYSAATNRMFLIALAGCGVATLTSLIIRRRKVVVTRLLYELTFCYMISRSTYMQTYFSTVMLDIYFA